jgi:hypothetical protein
MIFHSAMLGGERYPIRCPNCHRDIYVPRDVSNASIPLALVGAAFIFGFPSPASTFLLSGFGRWIPFVRAEIWAIGVLGAMAVFAYGGKLAVLNPDGPPRALRISVAGRLVNLAIQILMLVWMYLLWRDMRPA